MMKRFRTIISLALVFSLIAAFMAGCSNNSDKDVSPGDEVEATASELDPDKKYDYDYDTASQFLPNDELIMTVNGYDVFWQEYFYYLKYAVTYINNYFGPIEWDGEMESVITGETVTMNEGVLELANDMAQYYRLVESFAADEGIEITDEDMAGYEKSMIEYYGSEEALQEDMKANYLPKDVAIYMSKISDMYNKIFEGYYGTDASDISDEEVEAYTEGKDYFQAKHILFLKTDEEGNALSDEETAEKKQMAEDVLKMLNDYSGDDIAAYFHELIDEYGEDSGQSNYPDGYLYSSGTMVAEFEDAVKAMGDYEISGIVESEYGFHIIMKMPISYDSVPVNDSNGYTLRYYVAYEKYSSVLQERSDLLETEFADAYETIVPSKVFPIIEVEATDSEATE